MKDYLSLLLPYKSSVALLADLFANFCLFSNNCIIYLYGEIGVGKTYFCKKFLFSLGYRGYVKSPTYTFVEKYVLSNCVVYHFDFYRLLYHDELEYIGIRDYFNSFSFFLVEWANRGMGFLPDPDIRLFFSYYGEGRKVKIVAVSDLGFSILSNVLNRQGVVTNVSDD